MAEHAASAGCLRLVLVKSTEGAGRTHLLQQLNVSRPNTAVVRCSAKGTLGRLLSALTGVTGEDAQSVVQALMGNKALAALDPERRPVAAQLLAGLLTNAPTAETAGLDAGSRAEGARAQLVHIVCFAAATVPLVLAIDDAHFADAEAISFFDALAQIDTPLPALIVFTADAAPEFAQCEFLRHHERWSAGKRVPDIWVPALDGPTIDALLRQRGCPEALAARLTSVVAGNPGLAVGLWSVVERREDLGEQTLPLTFDGLRVESVRSVGAGAFALALRAAVLGDTFLEGALTATGPAELADLASSSFFCPLGHGPLGNVLGFVDRRVRLALAQQLSNEQRAQWLEAAGAWAVTSLAALPSAFGAHAEQLLPLALSRLQGPDASLWREAWAGWLGVHGRQLESLDVLSTAAVESNGVRRVALHRRIADAQLLAGQPDKALATLQGVGRGASAESPKLSSPGGEALSAQPRALLDRWESLSLDEANASVELVRAEAWSHLVRKEETVAAFGALERKLDRLAGPVAAHLWIRWAKSWGWFLCEILGLPADALRACEKVRLKVPAEVMKDDALALEFLRAQQIACASVGDFARALSLAEEQIALSRSRGDLRAQCLAWNARAILHFGQGELAGARRSFERSIDLARTTGWQRREAIATHNLALVLLEQGELDLAQSCEERYAVLSVAIGNHAATAEAPSVLAGVALARGDLGKAELLIAQARKAAEANGWTMLLGWARSLAGRLRVLKYAQTRDSLELSKAKTDFLAALDLFEEHSTAWTEEVDPGEVYALYAASLKLAGQDKQAQQALERGAKNLPAQNVVSLRSLDAGRAFVTGIGIEPALEWFENNGFQRVGRLWRQLAG